MSNRCPQCGLSDEVGWISTTNEWEYVCDRCDLRFNKAGEVRPADLAPDTVTHPRRSSDEKHGA